MFERLEDHGVGVDRRVFLAGLAAAVGASGAWPAWTLSAEPPPAASKARIRLVFSHHREDPQGRQSEQGWPYLGYDLKQARDEVLRQLQARCPESEFLTAVAYSVADAQKILQADQSQQIDAYVSYMLGGWAQAGQTFAAAGKPTVYVGDLYGASGEILVAIAEAKRKRLRAFGVSSSRFDDVVQAVRCIECLKKLRSSTIVVVGAPAGEVGKAITEQFGTKVVAVGFEPLAEVYRKIDPSEARRWAQTWIRQAQKVVEPTPQEIEKSATMYLAMQRVMAQHGAQAITINCLGGFYGGHLEAYPCLGYFQLNNDGLVGACEADLQSTLTMLVMSYLVGKPGYISDPVVDTATHQVVYLHCVAPSKVFGPAGPSNPYEIRSHAEDRKGAAIRSLMPVGHLTTTLQMAPTRKQILVHQAKTVGNVDDPNLYPKSCRTKLAAELIGDMDKLLSYWDLWGWHRVTFYGDHKQAVRQFAALAGFEVVEEA